MSTYIRTAAAKSALLLIVSNPVQAEVVFTFAPGFELPDIERGLISICEITQAHEWFVAGEYLVAFHDVVGGSMDVYLISNFEINHYATKVFARDSMVSDLIIIENFSSRGSGPGEPVFLGFEQQQFSWTVDIVSSVRKEFENGRIPSCVIQPSDRSL